MQILVKSRDTRTDTDSATVAQNGLRRVKKVKVGLPPFLC